MSLDDVSGDSFDHVSDDTEVEDGAALASASDSDSDDRPGSVVLVPEVERIVVEVDPDDRRGRLVVGSIFTLEGLGFQPPESEMSPEDRSARVRDLAMFKHTLDMTISSLQVS